MGKHSFLESKHVTPQIDCLGKMSTVLSFNTHSWVFQEIDGKNSFLE